MVNTIKQGDKIERITIIRNGSEASAFKADQENFDKLRGNADSAATNRARTQRQADIAKINSQFPNTQQSASGVRFIIQNPGTGAKPRAGQVVQVEYIGKLLDGTVFDRSDLRGAPLEFQAGAGRVIQGWDEMVLDMQVGEKRLVIIPPELAYGDRAVGGVIPANSFLVFEMELKGIK
ncbi:MAG: FKBP-type peptidyl-prolyl cis-trans isomerase [Treponema sp.]|nr:FKBP-type peptidyl-prolyl cis-trans isomerase [Treponema sp.]